MTTALNTAAITDTPTASAPEAAAAAPVASAKEIPGMEIFRDLQLKQRLAYRLAHRPPGISAEQMLDGFAIEQKAIADTITDPAFIDLAGKKLWEAKQSLQADNAFATSEAHEREVIEQVLHRRAAEHRANVADLAKPEARAALQTIAGNPTANDALPTLREVKLKETIEDLLHRDAAGTPLVEAHIDAIRDGMIREHAALGKIFDPAAPLYSAFLDSLKTRLPGPPETLAQEWMLDRQAAANVTVELLAGEGEAYVKATAVSREEHAKKLGIAPKAAAIPAPAASHAARAEASRDEMKINVQGL